MPKEQPPGKLTKEVTGTPAALYGAQDGIDELSSAAGLLGRNRWLVGGGITHRSTSPESADAFREAAARAAAAAIKVLSAAGED